MASATAEFPAAVPPPLTVNTSAPAASTTTDTPSFALPYPKLDVPTTITLLHAGLFRLRGAVHMLAAGGSHPSGVFADIPAQVTLLTQIDDLERLVQTLKYHGVDKDT